MLDCAFVCTSQSQFIDKLDLFGTAGLDPRTIANLDPATHTKRLFSSALGSRPAPEKMRS